MICDGIEANVASQWSDIGLQGHMLVRETIRKWEIRGWEAKSTFAGCFTGATAAAIGMDNRVSRRDCVWKEEGDGRVGGQARRDCLSRTRVFAGRVCGGSGSGVVWWLVVEVKSARRTVIGDERVSHEKKGVRWASGKFGWLAGPLVYAFCALRCL